jgi:uncharacterized SAM-binding protein YcdF (DUF218 family)
LTYTASKILWLLVMPSNLLFALALLGVIRALVTGRRGGIILALVMLVTIGIAGLSPLPNAVLLPLEERFPDWRAKAGTSGPVKGIAGVIVLGGASDVEPSTMRLYPLELNEAGDRILEMIALARRFPTAKIVFSGGSGAMMGGGVPEADEIRRKIGRYGLDPARITFENRSRNTFENAQFSRDLLQPKAGERWLLVTSAFHMPRSVGVFRHAGFDVEAYPVDFRTSGQGDLAHPFVSLASGLGRLDLAMKEWVGLASYFAMGRSKDIFPAP